MSPIRARLFAHASWLSSLALGIAACNSQVHPVAGDDDESRRRDMSRPVDPLPDLAGSVVDLASPRDLLAPPDGGGKPVLSPCDRDGECASGHCLPVGAGGAKICVASCRTQADCAGLFGSLFCEAKSAGSPDGFCIPPSPTHCASCTKDSECGVLAERCAQAPGDNSLGCHIDCSLSDAACPSDYACSDVPEAGPMGPVVRKLCVPKTKQCLDALGGFCDRVSLPQDCQRTNPAGTCLGQRTCLPGGRFDRCGAMAPQYRTCKDLDPPGCTLALAPDATGTKQHCARCGDACGASEDCCAGTCKPLTSTSDCGACGRMCAASDACCGGACTSLDTVQNCGRCGNTCPGMGLSSSDAFCEAGTKTCGMSCRGDNYDIDSAAANGCEVLDVVPPGHTQSSAADRGSKDCYDGSSRDNFTSGVPSDKREHRNPPVAAFSGTVGAAPDWWKVRADGGTLCVNDYDVTFSTGGGAAAPCYRLTLFTNKKTDSVTVGGAATGYMSSGSGSYSGDSDIFFLVEKTCSTAGPEQVTYTVSYHL